VKSASFFIEFQFSIGILTIMTVQKSNFYTRKTQAIGPRENLHHFRPLRLNHLAHYKTIGKTLAMTALILCLSGCTSVQTEGFYQAEKKAMIAEPNQTAAIGAVTIVGKRVTKGNAVDCPEIETSDGQRVAVKGLTGEHNIGATVSVTGSYGYVTSCKGLVLIATNITLIS
jgi:hypothetical protein